MTYTPPFYSSYPMQYNTSNYCFDNNSSLIQEAYDGLGRAIPYSQFGYLSNNFSISPCSSTSTTSSPSSIYSKHTIYTPEYTIYPMNHMPEDYFSLMPYPERNQSHTIYKTSESNCYYQQEIDPPKDLPFIRSDKHCLLNKMGCTDQNTNLSSNIKKERINKEDHMVPDSPTTVTASPSLPKSSSNSAITSSNSKRTRKTTKPCGKAKKMHPCSFCSREFARRYDANRHIRIHTGDKPYVCPCCRKCFARSDALNRHFKKEPTCSVFSENQDSSKHVKRSKR